MGSGHASVPGRAHTATEAILSQPNAITDRGLRVCASHQSQQVTSVCGRKPKLSKLQAFK